MLRDASPSPIVSTRPSRRAPHPRRHWRAPGSFARRSSAASRAALPETKVWREAEVLPASAVRSVSPTTSSNFSGGSPSASAAICSSTVVEPWPISTAPLKKVSRPSRDSAMRMVEGLGSEVLPQPYHMQAMPTPRRAPRRRRALKAATRASAVVPVRLQRIEAFAAARRNASAPARTASCRRGRAR